MNWRDDAACKGQPLEIFFPGQGDSGARAMGFCRRCRVRFECLEDARELEHPYGVWGGVRFGERASK